VIISNVLNLQNGINKNKGRKDSGKELEWGPNKRDTCSESREVQMVQEKRKG
jgi:hypothetical protein